MTSKTADIHKLRLTCARWLRDHVSDIDWGAGSPVDPKAIVRKSKWQMSGAMKLRCVNFQRRRDGKPPVKEVYVEVFDNPNPFKGWITLSLTNIQAHLQGLQTIYYGSRRSLDQALIMLDFDWHGEAIEKYGDDTDAISAAQFVRDALFSADQMYIEPSTGGLGAHAFLLVDTRSSSSSRLNEILNLLKPLIQNLIRKEGFKADFCDFYGNFTLFENGWQIPEGGLSRLGKLPRPRTAAQMSSLMSLETIPLAAILMRLNPECLSWLLNDFGLCDGWAEELLAAPTPSPATCCNSSGAGATSTATTQQQSVYCGDKSSSGEGESGRLAAIRSLGNPNERIFQAVYLLARQLQRIPSVEEAVAFYEAHGLNSGMDVEDRRRKRAADAVESCQKTFRAAEKLGVRRYLKLVERLISDEDLKNAKYARVLHLEDIAIALYVVTGRLTRRQPNPFFQQTVGQDFMVEAFKKLKEVGLSKRGMDGKKWAAIKRVLLRAGLLVKVGDYGTGFAEQFALGPNHPVAKEGVRKAKSEGFSL